MPFRSEYRFTKDKIQQLNLYTKVKTIDPLYLYGSIRYNLLEKWRVESAYGAVYQAQCWTLGLLVEDINQSPDGTQKKELKVEVYVTLLGHWITRAHSTHYEFIARSSSVSRRKEKRGGSSMIQRRE